MTAIPTQPTADSFHRSLYTALAKNPHLVIAPEPILPTPDPATVAAERTPAWVATCEAVPEARGCRTCGAILDAPCRTCTGKVTHDHKGREVRP